MHFEIAISLYTRYYVYYMRFDNLLLKNQLCHPIYSASNAIQRAYKKILKKWGITYPQYLILLALWEKDNQSIGSICEATYFDSGTAAPLIQKLHKLNLIQIDHLESDRRTKIISLTKKGIQLKEKMAVVPEEMICLINLKSSEALVLKKMIQELHQSLLKFET